MSQHALFMGVTVAYSLQGVIYASTKNWPGVLTMLGFVIANSGIIWSMK